MSIFFRLLFLMATVSVTFSPAAERPSPTHPSATDARLVYLLFVDKSRDQALEIEHAQADYNTAVDAVQRDDKVFRMNESLYHRQALAQIDWERSRRQLEYSIANRDALAEKVLAVTAGRNASLLQARLLQGQWVDDAEVKKAYIAEWDAQCLYQKKAVESAAALVAFADYDAQVTHHLHRRAAAAWEETLIKDHALLSAKERLAAEKRGDAACTKDLPPFYVPAHLPRT